MNLNAVSTRLGSGGAEDDAVKLNEGVNEAAGLHDCVRLYSCTVLVAL